MLLQSDVFVKPRINTKETLNDNSESIERNKFRATNAKTGHTITSLEKVTSNSYRITKLSAPMSLA
jgi:hypothetical protein